MAKTSLVDEDIEIGRRFVAALEQAGLPVAAAMWFREISYETWMLGIASPNVQIYGPLSVMRFADTVRQNGFSDRIDRDALFFSIHRSRLSTISRLCRKR